MSKRRTTSRITYEADPYSPPVVSEAISEDIDPATKICLGGRLKGEERNREPTPSIDYALIVARELHGLPVSPKELDRSQMQGIERSQGDGPWIQGAR